MNAQPEQPERRRMYLAYSCPEPAAVLVQVEGHVNVAVMQYFAALHAWCNFWCGMPAA